MQRSDEIRQNLQETVPLWIRLSMMMSAVLVLSTADPDDTVKNMYRNFKGTLSRYRYLGTVLKIILGSLMINVYFLFDIF